jgi:antitoxin ParD1/3/4
MKPKQTSLNVSLTEPLRKRLDAKCQRLAYSSASEYVRELIRKDLQREAIEQVDELLLEGLRSPSVPLTDADWQHWRRLANQKPSHRHATSKAVATGRR